MLQLTFGGRPLLLPTPEFEAEVEKLISTKLFQQPSGINADWNPFNYANELPLALPATKPNWPVPPSVKINQLYWPATGASRFAFGYFLIRQEDFEWLQANNTAAHDFVAKFYGELADPEDPEPVIKGSIEVKMFALNPRVLVEMDSQNWANPPATKIQAIYVVPLVDERFFWQFQAFESESTFKTWKHYFDKAKTEITKHRTLLLDDKPKAIFESTEENPADYFPPDKTNMAYQPLGHFIDAMANSFGYRFIFNPKEMRFSEPPTFLIENEDRRIGGSILLNAPDPSGPVPEDPALPITRIPDKLIYRYWTDSEAKKHEEVRPSTLDSFKNNPEYFLVFNSTLNTPNEVKARDFFDNHAELVYKWAEFVYDASYEGIFYGQYKTLRSVSRVPTTITDDGFGGTQDCYIFNLGSTSCHVNTDNEVSTRVVSLFSWNFSSQLLLESKSIPIGAKVAFVQAPEGGIPSRPRSNRPGKADCKILIEAPSTIVGTSIQQGDFMLTADEIEVKNWTDELAGEAGSRLVQVDRHADGAFVIGWICNDDGDPDFPVYDPDDPFWDPDLNPNCEFLEDGVTPNPGYNPALPSSIYCSYDVTPDPDPI